MASSALSSRFLGRLKANPKRCSQFRQLLRLKLVPNRSQTNCRTPFQYQLASWIPACSGNSCTAAFNSSHCLSSSAGGTPRTARISGPQALPRRRPTPTGRWCAGPLQRLRRRRCRPALGQQPDGVPPLPLPGHGHQDHPPAQGLGIHLNHDVSLSHPSPTPL